MAKIKRTFQEIKAAIKGSGGIKQRVIDRLGVTRPSLDKYLKKWPQLQDVMREEEETITDAYENALHKLALKLNDFRAVKFYLQTKGRNRGYGYELGQPEIKVNRLLEELSSQIERGGDSVDTTDED